MAHKPGPFVVVSDCINGGSVSLTAIKDEINICSIKLSTFEKF